METFLPGDQVVAINTDLSRPLCAPAGPSPHPYRFPDGPLRKNVVYHVESVTRPLSDGHQGLFLTGIRVLCGSEEIPWNGSRFRKVETVGDRSRRRRRRKQPVRLDARHELLHS